MGTHAYISIPAGDGMTQFVYVHYDGYPQHMIPQLNRLTDEHGIDRALAMILEGKELRGIYDGKIDAFANAREPWKRFDFQVPRGDYVYFYEDGKWFWSMNP